MTEDSVMSTTYIRLTSRKSRIPKNPQEKDNSKEKWTKEKQQLQNTPKAKVYTEPIEIKEKYNFTIRYHIILNRLVKKIKAG